jgi:hypothetical protein
MLSWILFRWSRNHYAVPVSGLQHLEATAIQIVLATRPVKFVSAYLSPTQPLIESDLSVCLSGGFPILMPGDINAEHTDWDSRLTTARDSLLHDYAIRNTCSIYGPDFPTMAPYTHNAKTDVLDIVVVKDFGLPVRLTVGSALRSDHLPILIDTTGRSSFQNLPDRPDFTRMNWAAFQACLDDRLQGNSEVKDEEAIDKCVDELTSAIQEAIAISAPSVDPVPTRGPLYPLVFRTKCA